MLKIPKDFVTKYRHSVLVNALETVTNLNKHDNNNNTMYWRMGELKRYNLFYVSFYTVCVIANIVDFFWND